MAREDNKAIARMLFNIEDELIPVRDELDSTADTNPFGLRDIRTAVYNLDQFLGKYDETVDMRDKLSGDYEQTLSDEDVESFKNLFKEAAPGALAVFIQHEDDTTYVQTEEAVRKLAEKLGVMLPAFPRE